MMGNRESMIVVCASCGAPGKVVIDTVADTIVERYFTCRCPRQPLAPLSPKDEGADERAARAALHPRTGNVEVQSR